jgi:hypothetical protein
MTGEKAGEGMLAEVMAATGDIDGAGWGGREATAGAEVGTEGDVCMAMPVDDN